MKRKFLIPTTLLAIFALASCGNNGGNSTGDTGSSNPSSGDTGSTGSVELTDDEKAAKLVADFDKAISARSNVVSAQFDHAYLSVGEEYTPVKDTIRFGSNDVLYYTDTQWGLVTEHYVFKYNDEVLGYNVDADDRILPDTIDSNDALNGILLNNSGLLDADPANDYYEVEKMAKLTAVAAVANAQGDREISMPTANSYEVSFSVKTVDKWDSTYNYFWGVSLSVEFDAATGALKSVSSVLDSYQASDVDLYEDGTFDIINDATSQQVFNWEATIGTRTAIELPVNYGDFFYTSFGLEHNGVAVAANSKVTVEAEFDSYEPIDFDLVNVLPATANYRFDEIDISIVDLYTGEESTEWYGSIWNNALSLSGNAATELEITLETRNFSFTFQLEIDMDMPVPEYINVSEYYEVVEDWGAYWETRAIADSYALGDQVYFNVEVGPNGCDTTYELELTCNGLEVALSYETVEIWYQPVQLPTVTFVTPGSYELTATSLFDTTVSTVASFTVA